jgi:hypothetical protein
MSEFQPRITDDVIVVPINKPCWLLDEITQENHKDVVVEMEGPHTVVAMATVIKRETIAGGIRPNPYSRRHELETVYDLEPRACSSTLEYSEDWLLVLFDDIGDRESAWLAREHVFFSEEAARRAMPERQKGLDAHRARLAVREAAEQNG